MFEKIHSVEFKAKVLAEIDAGMPIRDAVKKFGVKKNTLYAWTKTDGRKSIERSLKGSLREAQSSVRAAREESTRPVNGDLHGIVERLQRENALLRRMLSDAQELASLHP